MCSLSLMAEIMRQRGRARQGRKSRPYRRLGFFGRSIINDALRRRIAGQEVHEFGVREDHGWVCSSDWGRGYCNYSWWTAAGAEIKSGKPDSPKRTSFAPRSVGKGKRDVVMHFGYRLWSRIIPGDKGEKQGAHRAAGRWPGPSLEWLSFHFGKTFAAVLRKRSRAAPLVAAGALHHENSHHPCLGINRKVGPVCPVVAEHAVAEMIAQARS